MSISKDTEVRQRLVLNTNSTAEMAGDKHRSRGTGSSSIPADPIQPGGLFLFLNPRNPCKARRRFGRLYWKAWSRVMTCFFLWSFGATFMIIGLGCTKLCDETSRGLTFFGCGLVMFIPGSYAGIILINYVRCIHGFSYKDLPD